MKVWLSLLSLLLVASSVQAQPRPGAFTTIVSTDTTPTSICVGCTLGTTTPVVNSGLIAQTITLPNGAPTVTTNKLYAVGGSLFFNGIGLASGSSVAGTIGKHAKFLTINSLGDSLISEAGTVVTIGGTGLTLQGVVTDTAFGTHAFSAGGAGSQIFSVRNTTAGTANLTALTIGNDAAAALTVLQSTASTFTSSGANQANGTQFYAQGAGGLSVLATDGGGIIRFYSGGITERMRLSATGGLSIGNIVDPGAGGLRVTGNSTVLGNSAVTGNASVSGTLGVTATGTFAGNVIVGDRLQMAGTTAAFPAWRHTGAQMEAVLADNSNWASVQALHYIATATGNSFPDLTVTGALAVGGVRVSPNVVIPGGTYTAVAGDFVLASGFNVTLPAAAVGAVVDVKNYGGTSITVSASSGVIDGASTYVLSVQYQSVTVVGDGTNWWVR